MNKYTAQKTIKKNQRMAIKPVTLKNEVVVLKLF